MRNTLVFVAAVLCISAAVGVSGCAQVGTARSGGSAAGTGGWAPDPNEKIKIPTTEPEFRDIKTNMKLLVLFDKNCRHLAILDPVADGSIRDFIPDFGTYQELRSLGEFVDSIDGSFAKTCDGKSGMNKFKPKSDPNDMTAAKYCDSKTAVNSDPMVTTACRFPCKDFSDVLWLVVLAESGGVYKATMFAKGSTASAELQRTFNARALPRDETPSPALKPVACNLACPSPKSATLITIAGRTYCVCR